MYYLFIFLFLLIDNINDTNVVQECYGKPEPEHVNRIKDLYNDLGVSNTYAVYEEETHNLLHTHIQQASRLPHEFFWNLLERGCPRVGRKD